jgi:hypothetical protein
MELIREGVSIAHLTEMAERMFGGLVKAVVDVRSGLMASVGSCIRIRRRCSLARALRRPSCGASTCTPISSARRTSSSSIR